MVVVFTLALAALVAASRHSEEKTALALVTPFYSIFNVGVNPTAVLNAITTPDWQSCGNNDDPTQCFTVPGVVSNFVALFNAETVAGSIQFAFKEIVVAGDIIAVRGELSGVPKSLQASGFCNTAGARFAIMTQDIHEIRHGKFHRTYHIENLAAIGQQIVNANPNCTFPIGPSAQANLFTNINDSPAGEAVSGNITFTQVDDGHVHVTGNISGLLPSSTHGWHIHVSGVDEQLATVNGTAMCAAAGLHFNPTHVNHSDINVGHAGDLGNLVADSSGSFRADVTLELTTVQAIVGRALVIHNNTDDLGHGGNAGSLSVGNSGARLACGNIHFIAK